MHNPGGVMRMQVVITGGRRRVAGNPNGCGHGRLLAVDIDGQEDMVVIRCLLQLIAVDPIDRLIIRVIDRMRLGSRHIADNNIGNEAGGDNHGGCHQRDCGPPEPGIMPLLREAVLYLLLFALLLDRLARLPAREFRLRLFRRSIRGRLRACRILLWLSCRSLCSTDRGGARLRCRSTGRGAARFYGCRRRQRWIVFATEPLVAFAAALLDGLLFACPCFAFERVPCLLIDGPNFPDTYDCFSFFLKKASFMLPVRYPCKSTVTYK